MTAPTPSPKSAIILKIPVEPDQPSLLDGLDHWVQLGLIADAQMRQIAQQHLSCALPDPVVEPVATHHLEPSEARSHQQSRPKYGIPSPIPAPLPTSPPAPAPTPLIPRLTQAFIENFSITWLLFLGVFMVVLSSVVLAASQWQSVPPPGQYSILLAYTIAFWGAASWTQRQENLQITALMLRVTTLLIIPVNFWMIDSLGLWQSTIGWGLGIGAAIALSLMTLFLLHPKPDGNRGDSPAPQPAMTAALNTIALSGLHWGWDIPNFPVIATYVGTIGTAILISRCLKNEERGTKNEEKNEERGTENEETHQKTGFNSENSSLLTPHSLFFTIPLIAVAFATLLLVIRAVVAANVPWSQLGLAIGLCGWVISWISRTHESRDLWMKGGAKLLLLGWLVSVASTPPWQALAVSGLGLWIVGDRVRRYWTRIDLTTLFIVGLQTLWLVQRLVPGQLRQYLLDFCIQLSGNQGMPEAIWSLTVFPYVLLTLGFATYLYRHDRFSLGRYADWLALGLGVGLMAVSVLNPVTRSLNITLSTLTLAWVFRYREMIRPGYLHLFHGLAIAALLSWIATIFPALTSIQWAVILTGLAIAQWGLHLILTQEVLTKSVWYGGLGLGAIAYPLFALTPDDPGCAVWFALPTAMIAVGQRSSRLSDPRVGWLAAIAIFIGQPFIILAPEPYPAWGFGGCAVLMLWATGLTRSIWSAGLGVGFAILANWLLPYQLDWLVNESLTVWVTFTPALLWLAWTPLQSRSSPLAQIYTRGINGWAIALSAIFMIGFVFYSLLMYAYPPIGNQDLGQIIGYTLCITGAMAYRFIWHPTHLGLGGLATGLAVLTAEGIMALYPPLPPIIIAQMTAPHPLTPYLGLALLGWGWGFLLVNPLIPERFRFRNAPLALAGNYSSSHLVSWFYGLLGSLLVLAKLNDDNLASTMTNLEPLWYPALAVLVLWGMRWWYGQQSAPPFFTVTTDGVAIGLTALNGLILLDVIARWYSVEVLTPTTISSFGVLMALMLGAIAFRQWQQLTEWGALGLAGAVGLLVTGVTPWLGWGRVELAIALLGLGLLTQLAGDWLVQRRNQPYSLSLHLIPCTYGGVGWLLSQGNFTATTGLYTLTAAVIGIGVSRRQPQFKPLTFLSLAGTSLAAYQLLFYQMQQSSGGQTGDGVALLGGLAIALAIFYIFTTLERLGAGLRDYLRLTTSELAALGHCHWLLSNGFLFLTLFFSRSPTGHSLSIAILAGLAAYALTMGNTHFHFLTHPPDHPPTHRTWTALGILEFLTTVAYFTYQVAPNPVVWGQWLGAIATLIAVGLKRFPWEPWGWCPRPGHRTAMVLPMGTLLLTTFATHIPSILLVAAFYAWLAYTIQQVRLSYLSVFCIGWAGLWFLQWQQWEQVIWMALDVGGAALYVIQVDPKLRSPDQRNIRHNLRIITTGLLSYVSVAESLTNPWLGFLTLGLSLGLLLAGISLRTRAYLYVGTGTLLFELLRYTRRFVGQHPLQIWAVGIILGLGFIWVAATFEARRNQVNATLNYWRNELSSWE
ncbi:MAG: hypothetical protein VKJ64_05785 [Leptolyngbyaceae bacterium]|nr:hypothetical protein [Leptolyngbyaceae bacterium]